MLIKEIESLSNPFDAKYTAGDSTANDSKGIQPPNVLPLIITTNKLSENGL